MERPPSLYVTWRASAVDPGRIPSWAPSWAPTAWRWLNRTERLAWFAAVLVAPMAVQGLLRYLAARPTRRLGAYLAALLLLTWFAMASQPTARR